MIRVLIADDHSIVREGLKMIAQLANDIAIVGEAENGGQLLDCLKKNDVDLVIMDISMPGINSVNLITRVTDYKAKLPILVLSMHNEPQIAKRVLNAGVSGYVSKDNEPEILLAAIRKVARGGRFIDPAIAEKMIFEVGGEKNGASHDLLSKRELEILCLLARGKNLNQVADELSISNKTVSTHKMRLMKKMNFKNNADLLRYAIEYRLAE